MPSGRPPHKFAGEVLAIWSRLAADGADTTAKAVYETVTAVHGPNAIKLRTVQNILKGMRPPSSRSWTAWEDESESSEETAFLSGVDIIARIWTGIALGADEAKWGKRLHKSVQNFDPLVQYLLIKEYLYEEQLPIGSRDFQSLTSFISLVRHELFDNSFTDFMMDADVISNSGRIGNMPSVVQSKSAAWRHVRNSLGISESEDLDWRTILKKRYEVRQAGEIEIESIGNEIQEGQNG
jgi:hypothetical protein